MARKVEQAARQGERQQRERAREVTLPQLDPIDLHGVAGHPRLFVGKTWPAATDDVSRDWQARLVKRADDALDAKPIPFEPKKMLGASREAVRRISLLAGVYRFTGDAKYAAAVRRELADVCAFKHWQPDAFLATAEMMTAVSIGYDWCYDALPAAERKTIVAALVRNGLRPAIDAYADAEDTWPSMRNNWNLVCNGGTIVAALAVAEEEPKLAQRAMDGAMKSIRLGLALYDKNGGTEEGPMYHGYATRYLTFAAAALQTATAGREPTTTTPPSLTTGRRPAPRRYESPFGPLNWLKATDYRIAMTGPTGRVANFGDCGETLGNSAWVLWLAGEVRRADYAFFQIRADRDDPSVFDLLWMQRWQNFGSANGPTAAFDPITSAIALTNRCAGGGTTPIETNFDAAVVLRENFIDANAAFVAVRTGRTDASHSHLDLGNFVYDVLGERFACDLGADSYDLPGYLHGSRPDYLRTQTAGHNCLTIGDDSQPLAVEATTTTTTKDGGPPGVRIDLSDAYPDARRVIRTVRLDGRVLTIIDEVNVRRRTDVTWHFHTPATVTAGSSHAILDSKGKRVELRVLEPADATITTEPDVADPPQQPVNGITHVRVRVRAEKETTIRVELRPVLGN